jgi:hypothetical protein
MDEMQMVGPAPVTATATEVMQAYGWVVQIIHRDILTGAAVPKLYGPFGDEDAATMWMVQNGPESTLFTILPLFDRIW